MLDLQISTYVERHTRPLIDNIVNKNIPDLYIAQLMNRLFRLTNGYVAPAVIAGLTLNYMQDVIPKALKTNRVSWKSLCDYLASAVNDLAKSEIRWHTYETHYRNAVPQLVATDIFQMLMQMLANSELYYPDTEYPFTVDEIKSILKVFSDKFYEDLPRDDLNRTSFLQLTEFGMDFDKQRKQFIRNMPFDSVIIILGKEKAPLADKMLHVGKYYYKSVLAKR